MIGTEEKQTVYWTLAYRGEQGPALPILPWLSAEEVDRLSQFRFEKRRREWLLGRWTAKNLLRAAQAELGAVALQQIEVRSEPEGRPYIEVQGRRYPGWLSISHREELALCAVTETGHLRVGADLERIEVRNPAFVEDFFTSGEAEAVAGCSEAARELYVTLIWSAKEAVLKVLGKGLRLDTRQVEILPEANIPLIDHQTWQGIQVCCEHLPAGKGQVWWQRRGDYVLTMAVSGRGAVELKQIDVPAFDG